MEVNTNKEEYDLAIEQYKKCVAEIKMHQTLVKAALATIQESKDAIGQLAIKLTAAQEKIIELGGGKEDVNDGTKEVTKSPV